MPLKEGDIVHAAFQLKAFVGSGHQHALLISKEARSVIHHLTFTNQIPASLRRANTDTAFTASAVDFGNRRGKSEPKEFFIWPDYWAIDRPTLRKDIKAFNLATEHLRPATPSASRPQSSGSAVSIVSVVSATSSEPLVGQPETLRPRRSESAELIEREPPSGPRKPSLLHPAYTSAGIPTITTFSEAQVDDFVARAVRRALQEAVLNGTFRGPPGPPGPQGDAGKATNVPRVSTT